MSKIGHTGGIKPGNLEDGSSARGSGNLLRGLSRTISGGNRSSELETSSFDLSQNRRELTNLNKDFKRLKIEINKSLNDQHQKSDLESLMGQLETLDDQVSRIYKDSKLEYSTLENREIKRIIEKTDHLPEEDRNRMLARDKIFFGEFKTREMKNLASFINNNVAKLGKEIREYEGKLTEKM